MKYFFLSGFIIYYINIILSETEILNIKSEYGEMAAIVVILISLIVLWRRSTSYLAPLIASIVNLGVVGAGYYLRYKYHYIGNPVSNEWDFLFMFVEILGFTVLIYTFVSAAIKEQYSEKSIYRLRKAWGYSLGFAIAYTTLIISTVMVAYISGIWNLEILSSYFTKDTWSTFTPMLLSGFATVITCVLSQFKMFHAVIKANI